MEIHLSICNQYVKSYNFWLSQDRQNINMYILKQKKENYIYERENY